ncbi:MAG: hypothetical protein O3B01_28315 [Planctomycetota bacterium]|nr:hypothetical protein [Planctomycetota bacterium]
MFFSEWCFEDKPPPSFGSRMKNPQKLTSRAWWQKEATEYHQQANSQREGSYGACGSFYLVILLADNNDQALFCLCRG